MALGGCLRFRREAHSLTVSLTHSLIALALAAKISHLLAHSLFFWYRGMCTCVRLAHLCAHCKTRTQFTHHVSRHAHASDIHHRFRKRAT
jgi:hypothetical protein